jgi:hypothetical protein
MSTHERHLVLMTMLSTGLISLNFIAVITGVADGFYDTLTELLEPLLLNR